MAIPASDHLPDGLPPAARDVVAALRAAPSEPVKLLVSGGIGTGKSAVLAAVRTALRGAGVVVVTRPPRPGDPPEAAVVVDDGQLLGDDGLAALTDRIADSTATVVVAVEGQVHRTALRSLTTALERENPAITLGPLTPAEVGRAAGTALGASAPADLVTSLMAATAGVPFLVYPAIAAAAEGGRPDTPAQAARFALVERLRLVDGPVLDTLLVSSLSPDLGPDDVAAALHVDHGEARSLVDRTRATGLIEPSYTPGFLQSVHHCVAQTVGAARHHDIEISLLCSQIELSTLSADLALKLAEHGLRDDRLAGALTDLAGRVRGLPGRAARLHRAAAQAGATRPSAQLADALALTGDCATAGRLADELLTSEDPAERAAAVRIAASIAMHDGSAAQAADLFGWLGPYPDAFVGAAAATVLIARGDPAGARAALDPQGGGPPTSTARAARSLADGLLLSVEQPFAVAIAKLGQSLAGEQPAPGAAPDTPAALVTLAALHGGDPVRARSVIGRAVRQDADASASAGHPEFAVHRHRLLLDWVRMQDGQLTAATTDTAAVGGTSLHRRDALWAAALQTAIARRGGDAGAVQKHWYTAMEVLAEYSIDLFAVLPLGELWVAAARIRQVERLRHTIDEAFALLEALGNPPLWAVPLHWAGVHAGILANSPEAVAPHGQALAAAGREGPAQSAFARVLATAGRTWLRVLANQVDTDEVGAAARALSQFGLTSDAMRLASQAALQATDARVSGSMLQLARDLKQTVAEPDIAGSEQEASVAEPRTTPARPATTRLSDREREVADLLLLGMPYRDIGSQLFISAKTVEHHVARIRRRLGAESRSEMLSMLRAISGPHS
ncbi:MAG: isoniazid response ATPase/transcriptional regulator IniR [Actinobacteria bacterium]|nr:isoniazid response ATPase/transcriptional regulator IniR [Actinomycetota bacterium]